MSRDHLCHALFSFLTFSQQILLLALSFSIKPVLGANKHEGAKTLMLIEFSSLDRPLTNMPNKDNFCKYTRM